MATNGCNAGLCLPEHDSDRARQAFAAPLSMTRHTSFPNGQVGASGDGTRGNPGSRNAFHLLRKRPTALWREPINTQLCMYADGLACQVKARQGAVVQQSIDLCGLVAGFRSVRWLAIITHESRGAATEATREAFEKARNGPRIGLRRDLPSTVR